MTTPRPPRCALASAAPVAWRVTVALPDGGPSITLPMLADNYAEAAMLGAELAGPGSRVRRIERQEEWA